MNNKIMYNGQVLVDFDALADKYTRAEVDALVSAVFKYKGTVATYADLENIPTADLSVGDCYNVTADGNNYAWTGTTWDKLSGTVDLSNYYTKTQVDNLINSIDLSAYYTKTQVDSKVSTDIAAAITAIPVSDLLHFKGHVNSVEDLPSTGQASGTQQTGDTLKINDNQANALISGSSEVTSNSSCYKKALDNIGNYAYYLTVDAITGNWLGLGYGVMTNYPECISFGFRSLGTTGGNYKLFVPEIYVKYDVNKPVYYVGGFYADEVKNDTYTTNTSYSASTPTLVGNDLVMYGTKNLSQMNQYEVCVVTYNDDYIGEGRTTQLRVCTNLTSVKYGNVADSRLAASLTKTFKNKDGYIWNENMVVFGTPDGNTNHISYCTNITNVVENEVYTVGSNNLLYRCNATPAWELLSKQDKPLIVTYNSANNTADYTSAQIKAALDADTPVYLHVETTSGLETINMLLPFVYADDTEAQAVLSNSYSSSGNTSSSTITYSIDTNGDGTIYNVANVTSGELTDALDDYLATDNTTPYTPLADYNPATKKYVDDAIGGSNNIQYATMPTADATTVDKVVQYVGTTNANYTNGYFYKGISTTTGSGNEEVTTYSWSLLNVQKIKTVNSTSLYGSGNIDLLPYNFVYTLSLAGYTGDPINYTLTASELTNVNGMINHALQRLGTAQINNNMPISFIISGPAAQSRPSCVVTINAGDFSAKRQTLYFMGSFVSGNTNYTYGLIVGGTWSGNVFTTSAGTFVTTTTSIMTSNNTTSYTPTGNYNPASKLYVDTSAENLANKYDSTATYAVGDYATYNGVLYKCNTTISTAEDWDSTHWTAVKVDDKFSGKLDSSKVKSAYSTTSGDVYDVTYINSVIGQIDSLLQEL